MAKLSRRRVAREWTRLLIAQPQRRAELVKRVGAYIVAHKMANQLHLFASDVADELLLQQKHLSADVITAFGLTTGSRESVAALLRRVTGAVTVALTESIDPKLLGGIVIRTPRLELDASVKRQLSQLAGGTN